LWLWTNVEWAARQRRILESQKPITVEVFALAPVLFFHCQHCELIWQYVGVGHSFRQEQSLSCIPDDLKQEYQRISDWLRDMAGLYGSRLKFKVIDAVSIEGWFKSLWYGLHRYPAIVVDHKTKAIGADLGRATALIEERLARPE